MSRNIPQRFTHLTSTDQFNADLVELYSYYNDKCNLFVPGEKTEKYATGVPKLLKKDHPCLAINLLNDQNHKKYGVRNDASYLIYTLPVFQEILSNYLIEYDGQMYRIGKLRIVHKLKTDKIGEYELALI